MDAPPLEYSLNPENEIQPYAEYTLQISAPGFEPVTIAGTEILSDVTALQNVQLRPSDETGMDEETFVIPAHTLYGNYPEKIPEDEIKPTRETGEIVLSRVVVPEYIVVPVSYTHLDVYKRQYHCPPFPRPGRAMPVLS